MKITRARTMAFLRRPNIKLPWTISARSVVVFYALLFLVISLPWNGVIDAWFNSDFAGVPLGFMAMILVLPILVLFILNSFIKIVEDIDRHDRELENE